MPTWGVDTLPSQRVPKRSFKILQAEIGADLDSLSAELKGKSEELLSRNISQTKHFFKKLKGYIKFIAPPSVPVEDSR